MNKISQEDFFERLAVQVDLPEPDIAPARLKSRVYSALTQHQAASGALASLTESKSSGRALCVFEELVEIAPVGSVKSLNLCRTCHARLLAETFEAPPIYWHGCPYVDFGKG